MRQFSYSSILLIGLITLSSCQQTEYPASEQLYQTSFSDVRLGDGVPLQLNVAIRWHRQLDAPQRPDSILEQIIFARGVETVRRVSHGFESVDSVFMDQREWYLSLIKDQLTGELGAADFAIDEVIVLDIQFPSAFTDALEQMSLKDLEEERIVQANQLDIARAAANKKKAKADGEVAIARAEAEGRLQAIQAQTEANRRKSEMARAETEAAVARTAASAEADRLRKIKDVEVEKQRDLEMVAVEKQRALDQVGLEKQLELAQLCESNPVFASFLVNRELASNVEIAVLPTTADANVFGGLLQSRLPGKN